MKVCLDAGHGDQDWGAVSPSGRIKEKDMALDVCLRAKHLFEMAGVEVVMTRDDDTFLPLPARPDICNEHDCDIFISYHFNSASSPARGFEIFSTRPKNNSDLLAADIASAHRALFPDQPYRGVREANFTVLVGTACPSVLVEGEFIHTFEGEAFIKDKNNRDKMAQAVVNGALNYLGVEKANNEGLSLEKRIARIEEHLGL